MGLTGIRPSSLLLILFITLIVFGTKRLRTLGDDLGAALKSFRRALKEDEATQTPVETPQKLPDQHSVQ